jgi:transposase InsO family protein
LVLLRLRPIVNGLPILLILGRLKDTDRHGVTCSMSRSGNVWDNAAMERVFSWLTTERTERKTYRPGDAARAEVFDYMERLYNGQRRHSTIGYMDLLRKSGEFFIMKEDLYDQAEAANEGI